MEAVTTRRNCIKNGQNARGWWAMKSAARVLALFGLAVLGFWYLTNDGSKAAMLLMLSGVAVLTIAILLHFISPSRFLHDEVSDAIAISSIRNTRKLLSAMMIEMRGIYVPAAESGTIRVFIPVSGSSSGVPDASGVFVAGPEHKGVFLEPPGYALLLYTQRIGADFSDERLEYELADVLENTLELVSKVKIVREGNKVIKVSMSGLANAGMCRMLRKESILLCTQTGCPTCSFVACAIVKATGRHVRIADVSVNGKKINATFELM